MGNWASTIKSASTTTVDASAFNEEKAPSQASRSLVIPDQKPASSATNSPAEQPKPKINPSNNSGMRSTDALK